MEFNPNNTIVKLCLQGMGMEENGNPMKQANYSSGLERSNKRF